MNRLITASFDTSFYSTQQLLWCLIGGRGGAPRGGSNPGGGGERGEGGRPPG